MSLLSFSDPPPHPHSLRPGVPWILLLVLAVNGIAATPIEFNIPAQSADRALVAFTSQSELNLLYSPSELKTATSTAVIGQFEPTFALTRLLRDTGFGAREQNGRYIVTRIPRSTGLLVGTLITADGSSPAGTKVYLPQLQRTETTNRRGEYIFENLPEGRYQLVATRADHHPLHINAVEVQAHERTYLQPQTLQPAEDPTLLEAVVVMADLIRRGPLDPGPTIWGARHAGGNLDLNRTSNDALPYTIYDRDRIVRSGVVGLNQFLQRELIDTDATARPPEQNGSSSAFATGSSNLSLRGFSTEETVVLVNGRRLPEVLTSGSGPLPPDVNFIPLSLVQQVQVLPASASALYSGNAVGGVINILLRPDQDVDTTEVTTTYTNATENFDAAYSSVSLLHTQSLLDGALRLRLNANFVKTTPATESELNHHVGRLDDSTPLDRPLFLATPNVRSADGSPLLPHSTSPVTSVAPGANGSGSINAFADRAGLRSNQLFDSPGSLATSLDSTDYPYGRRQNRALYFLSALYDAAPWLEFGLDAAFSQTTINRGFDVFKGDLFLRSDLADNPFGQDIRVSLNETAVNLTQNYNEAQLDFFSVVGSALLKWPGDWKTAFDAQVARSTTRYRGITEADRLRWQELVDAGLYHPLRDTQIFGPPPEFYDRVLIYNGARDQFATVGDYQTLDAAMRISHENLALPTGDAVLNLGTDYRLSTLASSTWQPTFGDGTPARPPLVWQGRSIERVSFFGELQAPLLNRSRLPAWLTAIEGDAALRYVMADSAAESNLAPTVALKLELAMGLTVRGSFTTSNRFPTPHMSRQIGSGLDDGTGIFYAQITDPLRQETYDIEQRIVINPNLRSESAITQTVGLIFQHGDENRFRASLDFFDTRKSNEIVGFGPSELINLESFFPERVERSLPQSGDPHPVGRVTSIRAGAFNLASRHSQNWQLTVDYLRPHVLGGTLDFRSRVVYFQKFEREIFEGDAVIDEIREPSGSAGGLLKYRATFGGGWSRKHLGLGLDGQYFHSRRLPRKQWFAQGARTIDPFWQFDAYLQADLGPWLLPTNSSIGLRGQLRVDNLLNEAYPFYASEETGAGVQPYGDWRGRTFSLSLTAEF